MKPKKNRCPHCGQKMPVSLAAWPLGTRISVKGWKEVATVVGRTNTRLRVVRDGWQRFETVSPDLATKAEPK